MSKNWKKKQKKNTFPLSPNLSLCNTIPLPKFVSPIPPLSFVFQIKNTHKRTEKGTHNSSLEIENEVGKKKIKKKQTNKIENSKPQHEE